MATKVAVDKQIVRDMVDDFVASANEQGVDDDAALQAAYDGLTGDPINGLLFFMEYGGRVGFDTEPPEPEELLRAGIEEIDSRR